MSVPSHSFGELGVIVTVIRLDGFAAIFAEDSQESAVLAGRRYPRVDDGHEEARPEDDPMPVETTRLLVHATTLSV
jgi:hypothetical protein